MKNILYSKTGLLIINVLLLFFSVNSIAQTPPLIFTDQLPTDQNIIKGVLPNGMTYYIHKTDVTKDVASYYIIQNVGSVLENDNQQGLAHFLEHMAFNGTENFADKGILNNLQEKGLVFGKDINAYTSFDETVYNINNLPTTPKNIDTGLLILRDWSNYLLLTEKEIDAERGVIKEEWRTRQNGGMRIFKQTIGTLYNNAKYANRLPLGKMDIIDNFEYKALRDFYHDWYRTDLQAIAVIGDIDPTQIEDKIVKLFSSIPKVENPKKRFNVKIPENKELIYSLAKDKEVTTSQINFGIRFDKELKPETTEDLKTSLIHNMIIDMLYARLDEIKQKPDAPFLGTRLQYGHHSRLTEAFSFQIYPKPNQQKEAFKAGLTEVNRAVKYGFTNSEIERSITKLKSLYERQIKGYADRSHDQIINSIKKNYLEHSIITDIKKEYELASTLFFELNQAILHQGIKDLYKATSRYMVVTGVETENNLTKEEALTILKEIEDDNTIEAYSDSFSGKTLISTLEIKPGAIVSERTLQAIGSTTFTLSNGVKVHYKFVDKNKNSVQLNARSYGGLSLIEDTNLPSAQLMKDLISLSGLGDYSATELSKVLAGKTARTIISLSNLTESIIGGSTTKDVASLLQMVHLRFVKPRFDKEAYQVLIDNLDNYIIRRSNTINEIIKDSVTATLYGNNNPKRRLINKEFAKDVSFESAKTTYMERFHNAADFEFFIVGDVEISDLRPLLETYIASIPTNAKMEKWKKNDVSWTSNNINKDITLKMEDPKSSVKIGYKTDIKYSLKKALVAKALGDMLKLRYLETLREQEGGTYSASAIGYLSKRPNQRAILQISFDCNPEKVKTLTGIAQHEISKIAQGEILQSDLDKTLSSYLKERKEQQDYNTYDMNVLINYFREGYNMNAPENFENLVRNISKKDIQDFAKKLLFDSKSYEIVFNPDGT